MVDQYKTTKDLQIIKLIPNNLYCFSGYWIEKVKPGTFESILYSKSKKEINKVKDNQAALRKSDEVLTVLLDGNNLDINKIFSKDSLIKSEIRIEIISRINFCRKAFKESIPNLVKLPEGMEMTEDRLEILTDTYPQYYLNMFEKTRNGN